MELIERLYHGANERKIGKAILTSGNEHREGEVVTESVIGAIRRGLDRGGKLSAIGFDIVADYKRGRALRSPMRPESNPRISCEILADPLRTGGRTVLTTTIFPNDAAISGTLIDRPLLRPTVSSESLH